jgi:predicted transcriptional regulator
MDNMNDKDLEEIVMLTVMINEHQRAIKELGKRRRVAVLRLHKASVPKRLIAESMGVTEQNVYKIIKGNTTREPRFDENGEVVRKAGRRPKMKRIK